MDITDGLFIEGLMENNTEKLLLVPKSDLHNHSTKGCRREWLEEKIGRRLTKQPERFAGLDGMQEWFTTCIKPYCCGSEGIILRWEGAFAEAGRNNIAHLTIEKLFVDLLYDKLLIELFDSYTVQELIQDAAASYAVNEKKLLAYARRRGRYNEILAYWRKINDR